MFFLSILLIFYHFIDLATLHLRVVCLNSIVSFHTYTFNQCIKLDLSFNSFIYLRKNPRLIFKTITSRFQHLLKVKKKQTYIACDLVLRLVALFQAKQMKLVLLICCKRTDWQGGKLLPSIPFIPPNGLFFVDFQRMYVVESELYR